MSTTGKRGGRREGAGRPRVGQRIQIWLPDDVADETQALAHRLGTTRSQLLREVIVAAIASTRGERGSHRQEVYDAILGELYAEGLLPRDPVLAERVCTILDRLHELMPELTRMGPDSYMQHLGRLARVVAQVVTDDSEEGGPLRPRGYRGRRF